MIERIPAWQCISRGPIAGARPYVGIWQDRKTEFAYAAVDIVTTLRFASGG